MKITIMSLVGTAMLAACSTPGEQPDAQFGNIFFVPWKVDIEDKVKAGGAFPLVPCERLEELIGAATLFEDDDSQIHLHYMSDLWTEHQARC